MPKPYTGPADETCPLRGGALCSEVCPTCKFQEKFITYRRETPTTPDVRYDCALFMQHVIAGETNQRVFEQSASIDAFKNEVVVQNKQAMSGAVVLAQRLLSETEVRALRAEAITPQIEAK